jgi:PAS domain S-box-containing protein
MSFQARSPDESIAALSALQDERMRYYEGMSRITLTLLSSFSLDEILPKVLKEATTLFGNDSAAMSIKEGAGFIVHYAEGFLHSPLGVRMVLEEEPHTVRALSTKEVQFIEDAWTDERTNHAHMRKWDVRSVIVIPLVIGQRELGAAFLNWHDRPVHFDDNVRDAVTRLSAMLSLALANAELIKERDLELRARKQAQEALQLSEEKFAIAFASNPAIISMTRLEDGVYLDVNNTWESLTGYGREEVIGRSARLMPIWPSQDDVSRFVQELNEKGFVLGREQAFLKKSGELFITELSSQILDIGGQKVILSTMVDITQRKQTEEALRASEENLRLLVKEASEAMAVLDAYGVIQAVSQAGSGLLGYEESDLVGKPAQELAQTLSRLEVTLRLEDLRLHGTKPAAASVYVKSKSGKVLLLSLNVRVVNVGTRAEKYLIKFNVVNLPEMRESQGNR